MVVSTVILGWGGIAILLGIIGTFKKLAKHNEYGFIHILMALMYSAWLPVPIALNQILQSDILVVGTIFGMAFLIMQIITMTLQTGHIVHLVKQEQTTVWEERGSYMMATLSSPYETLANIFKSIWAFFVAIAFLQNDHVWMATIMFLLSSFIIYFFIILLNYSLVTPLKRLSRVKPNPIIFNLETLIFFIVLLVYLTSL